MISSYAENEAMQSIPMSVLGKLYNRTSLKNENGRVRFSLKSRLAPAVLSEISQVAINGRPVEQDSIQIAVEAGEAIPLNNINVDNPLDFALGTLLTFYLDIEPLTEGNHELNVVF